MLHGGHRLFWSPIYQWPLSPHDHAGMSTHIMTSTPYTHRDPRVYSGVLFDLFGTIVAPFRRQEHTEAIRDCARCLGIPFEDCHHHWVTSFPRRIRGEFLSVAENFEWIIRQLDRVCTPEAFQAAEVTYDRFTLAGLEPIDDAISVLAWLKANGIRVGLVSNCAPDIPRLWSRTQFAPYVDHCSFSCQVKSAKPDPTIYERALEALGLKPEDALFVGDGSDDELTGAARCGIAPVLVARDLSNTYDDKRRDVETWTGRVVKSLDEVRCIIEEGIPVRW